VLRQIGAGGMGTVFEVRRPGDPRRLAAKLLISTSAQAKARFEREGQLVARLEHPGIIPVLGSGTTDAGRPYLIFEFVDGRSLKDVIQHANAPLDEETIVDWGEQLASALGAAHRLGIVHRDIKPANIMIDAHGRVRVADFGIALAADLDRLTRSGHFAGTPLYMAREQFVPDGAVGPWTDVHAVGAVLYEALTGQAPYDAATAANVVAQILHADAPSVRDSRRGVSAGLTAVIARCLEKDPARRYADGDALAADLARLRRGERISAVSALLRAARRRLARRTTWLAAAALCVVLLGAGAALWVQGERQARQRDEELSAAASDLDGLAAQVRPESPSERALEQAQRALERARALLADVPDGPARARLDAAVAALQARRDLAVASQLARAAWKQGAQDPAALRAALDALALVPPPAPGLQADAETVAREEARAWLLYLGGRLDEAAAAATRLIPGDAPASGDQGPEAWLAEPANRAAWLLCWCALRRGDAQDVRRRAASLPALLRARVFAIEASTSTSTSTEAAELTRAALAAAAGPRGPDAALVEATLRVDELLRANPADLSALLAALAQVRLLSDPPSPARVPRPVQAQASLLEGQLLLAIGWPASAAEAFARHGRVAVGPPSAWPAATLIVPAGDATVPLLLAPDAAAALGEALARGLTPDAGDGSGAGARLALEQLLVVERAREALARPSPALQRPGAWSTIAQDLTASAEADLALAIARPEARPDARERARRGAALAVELSGSKDARALAALARAEAACGQVAAAERALGLALELAPRAWETHHAAAVVALARGLAEDAVASAEAAVAALATGERRLLERGELTRGLLLPLVDALGAGGYAVDALRLLDLASRCADRDRLTFDERARLHARLARDAADLRNDDVARAAAERTAALAALADRLNRAGQLVASINRQGQLADTPELRQAYLLLLTESPHDVGLYVSNHTSFGRLRGEGFDNLALGFECNAATVIEYLNSPSFAVRKMTGAGAEATAASIRMLTGQELDPDPSLPYPRDLALRKALGGLYCADLRIPLTPDDLARCLHAARDAWLRRPTSQALTIVLGRLLVVAGAPADALTLLRRAPAQDPLCPPEGRRDGAYVPLYEALALASMRRWDEARFALTTAKERGLWLSHLIREEPLFWEDRALSGTLLPWAEEVAKEVEARHGKQ
jgi:hypothetical protein